MTEIVKASEIARHTTIQLKECKRQDSISQAQIGKYKSEIALYRITIHNDSLLFAIKTTQLAEADNLLAMSEKSRLKAEKQASRRLKWVGIFGATTGVLTAILLIF